MAILILLGISQIWRRATFRYIRDPRRRRQFLLIRRLVVGCIIIIIIGAIRRRGCFCCSLPRLPLGRKQGQLIGRELLAFAIAPGIQQLAQQGLDFVPLGALAIQLRHQVQHHLL